MFKVLVLFGPPLDVAAFERHFEDVHLPMLERLPKLEGIGIDRVAGVIDGPLAVYLLVELLFATEDALQERLNSDAGKAMARDYASFASGGVTILLANSRQLTPAANDR